MYPRVMILLKRAKDQLWDTLVSSWPGSASGSPDQLPIATHSYQSAATPLSGGAQLPQHFAGARVSATCTAGQSPAAVLTQNCFPLPSSNLINWIFKVI